MCGLFDAGTGGQPDRGAALGTDRPQVAGIGEHDAVAADIGKSQQAGTGQRAGRRRQGTGENKKEGQDQAYAHERLRLKVQKTMDTPFAAWMPAAKVTLARQMPDQRRAWLS